MLLSKAGRIVEAAWFDLPLHYANVELGAWIVMPDHVHGIVVLSGDPAGAVPAPYPGTVAVLDVGAGLKPAPDTGTLAGLDVATGLKPAIDVGMLARLDMGAGLKPAPTVHSRGPALFEIVRALKSYSARRINTLRGTPGRPVWQRSYYEHVIRGDQSLQRIREYIQGNPSTWTGPRE